VESVRLSVKSEQCEDEITEHSVHQFDSYPDLQRFFRTYAKRQWV
jgi:hypothetical protein